jgi:hypothetical protein
MSYHDQNGHVSQKCENFLCAQHAVMAQILFQFFSAPVHGEKMQPHGQWGMDMEVGFGSMCSESEPLTSLFFIAPTPVFFMACQALWIGFLQLTSILKLHFNL